MGTSIIGFLACQRAVRGLLSKQMPPQPSKTSNLVPVPYLKPISLKVNYTCQRCFSTEKDAEVEDESDLGLEGKADDDLGGWMDKRAEDSKDRSREIPLEISLSYMESAAYKATYGDSKIWELYRRNFAMGKTFRDTRKTCIRQNKISTGSPCPICRDEYLVIDYRNLKLINQFLNEYNGEVLSTRKTGVCQTQNKKLLVEIERARDRGLLKVDPPFVEYDYSFYKPRNIE